MLLELGLLLALFVIADLMPPEHSRVKRACAWIAVLFSVLVVADVSVRVALDKPLLAVLQTEKKQPVALSVASPSVEGTDTQKQPPSFEVTRVDGGSIQTPLGYGIAVAKGSTLKREWIAVHHKLLPVRLVGTPGVRTVYESKQYSGDFRYQSIFEIEAIEPIRALEVRFLVFDVWGNHVRTLSYEDVADRIASQKETIKGLWSIYSENEVEQHYASIVYIARIRLADGRVVEAPVDPVVKEAQKFSSKFTAQELEPESTKPSPQGKG